MPPSCNMVRDYIRNMFGYMLDDKTKEKITNKNPKGENTMLTDVADQIYSRGIEDGEQKGRLEGEQKGRLKGQQEGRLDTARRMLENNLPVDVIGKVTDLSEAEIQALR